MKETDWDIEENTREEKDYKKRNMSSETVIDRKSYSTRGGGIMYYNPYNIKQTLQWIISSEAFQKQKNQYIAKSSHTVVRSIKLN